MATVITVNFPSISADNHPLSIANHSIPPRNDDPQIRSGASSYALTGSFVYQRRAIITAVTLLLAWLLVLFSFPPVKAFSPQYLITCCYGGLCFLTGVMLRLWATGAIGHRKQQLVVRDGPYEYCRNPLYWGTFLIALSMAAFLQSLIFAAILIVPVSLYVLGVVPAEERLMLAKFGADYANYCQTTPRWWPKIRRPSPQRDFGWSQTAWNAEFRRCQCWCLLIAIALGSCQLRSADWWPHLFHLL